MIDSHPVMVFSKSYCPYCRASKALLGEKGVKFEVYELDVEGMFTFTMEYAVEDGRCGCGRWVGEARDLCADT